MTKEVVILIVEDDEGHAGLIRKNLKRAGLINQTLLFRNGDEVLDFLFSRGEGPHRQPATPYILLLDIRMPKIDGIEVLQQIKAETTLRRIPVIMITTTDDPREVQKCHDAGCSNYITKPVDYEKFVEAIRQLGMFLAVVQVPEINGEPTP